MLGSLKAFNVQCRNYAHDLVRCNHICCVILSTLGAHATVRGVRNTVAAMAELIAVFIRSSNAWLHVQETADFACVIHSHPLQESREGDIGAEKRRTVRFQGIESPSVVMAESGVLRYARTYNPYQMVYMQ